MSFADSEGPPTKKRRFFTEKTDILDTSLAQEPSLPDELDAFPSLAAAPDEGHGSHHPTDSDEVAAKDGHAAPVESQVLLGFDQEMLESFVGDKVPPDVMKQLREASGDNMERAVNMFFDGSWKTASSTSSSARG